MKMMGGHSLLLIALGEGYLLVDRVGDAAVVAEQGLRLARAHGERSYEARALLLLADTALHSDPPVTGRVVEQATRALALANELELRPLAAHCHLTLGRASTHEGNTEGATRHLGMAAALFREMHMGPWLSEAEADLQRLR
jgi:hypothetical protein